MTDAAWPNRDDLAQILDVENVDDWQDRLDAVMASAIDKVKRECSGSAEAFDVDFPDGPDDSLNSAALRMAELMSLRPGQNAKQLAADPAYQAHLFGHRRSFGIA